MSKKKIKISVITIVKNGMPYLKDTISSFNSQTLKEKEHIIVYSPSEDKTKEFLISQKKKFFIDCKSPNKFGAINLGIKKSKGELIGLLHADDFYPNNKILERIYDFYKSQKSDLIYGNVKFCKKNNKKKIVRYWKSEKFNIKKLRFGWMPPHTSIYVKNEILKKTRYSINYPISGDYEFILRLFSNKVYKINYLDQDLCTMRTGGDSTKLKKFNQKFKEDLQIGKKFFKFYFLVIIFKILRKIQQLFIV